MLWNCWRVSLYSIECVYIKLYILIKYSLGKKNMFLCTCTTKKITRIKYRRKHYWIHLNGWQQRTLNMLSKNLYSYIRINTNTHTQRYFYCVIFSVSFAFPLFFICNCVFNFILAVLTYAVHMESAKNKFQRLNNVQYVGLKYLSYTIYMYTVIIKIIKKIQRWFIYICRPVIFWLGTSYSALKW